MNQSLITFNGLTMSTVEWSKKTGIPSGCIRKRIRQGWDVQRALTTPSAGKKRIRKARVELIRDAIASLGPSSIRAIAIETGISEQDVGLVIRDSRKKEWSGARIRQAGKARDGGKLCWIYELSDEPDAHVDPQRSKPVKKLDVDETFERRHLKALLAQIKPFRDEMLFRTAGRPA